MADTIFKNGLPFASETTDFGHQIAELPAGDTYIDHLDKQLKQKKLDLENIKKMDKVA